MNIYLGPGSYSVRFTIISENDLKTKIILKSVSNIIENTVYIDYIPFYGEVSTTRIYKMDFSIKEEYNLIYSIYLEILENTNYEVIECVIYSKNNIIHTIEKDKLKKNANITTKYISDIDKLIPNMINIMNNNSIPNKYEYPLVSKTFDHTEIIEIIKLLLNGKQLTMGNEVKLFEEQFAEYIGSKYAVMVNSGSSANLLAVAAITNYMYINKLNIGDEVIVPAVCWSTSVWPLLQCGLVPIFVDINLNTMNLNETILEKYITPKTKLLFLVHIMGNCTNMEIVLNIAQKYNLLIIEDTCESLGSSYNGKKLGNFGTFGTYSFYYSHHITTIEGGMVTCNSKEDYELLLCLRAHGWTRYFSEENKLKYKNEFPEIDTRYMFVNVGYNLRPMEIQGVMGQIQLKKLDYYNLNRIQNFNILKNKILNHVKNNNIIYLPNEQQNSNIAWFGLCIYLTNKYSNLLAEYIDYLEKNNVETRPIVTGNFTKQPYFKINNIVYKDEHPNADILHNTGLYIGLPCENIYFDENKINKLVDILLDFF